MISQQQSTAMAIKAYFITALVLLGLGAVNGDCDQMVFSTNSNVNAKPECPMPRDCKQWYEMGIRKDGVYPVNPNNDEPFQVYCDMTTDGGGWTVFQRRTTGTLDFYKTWKEYEEGFGDLKGEFWLGLKKIHRLTPLAKKHSLRIDLHDWSNNKKYAKYSSFHVRDGSVKYQYQLDVTGYSGNARDRLSYHNGSKFSTRDKDNDGTSSNCAISWKGAWWYNNCYHSNLNGRRTSSSSTSQMRWYSAVRTSEMKMKRQN